MNACFVLQNPLLTMVWVSELNCTLLPTVIFAIDTYGFCQKYSRGEIVLFSTYGVFCIFCGILSPVWLNDFGAFQFFDFPTDFGWRFYCIGWSFMILYWTIQILGSLWNGHRQKRQMSPAVVSCATMSS